MLVVTIILSTLGFTFAGYAGSSSNNVGDGQGYGFSGSFSGANGGGFSGGDIPIPPIAQFDFGVLTNYFENLRKYHEQFLNKIQQNVQQIPNNVVHGAGGTGYSGAGSYSSGGGTGYSSGGGTGYSSGGGTGYSSGGGTGYNSGGGIGYPNVEGTSYHNGAGTGFSGGFSNDAGGGGFGGGYGGGFSGGDGGAAFASGSIGPQGGYQSAKVFPENSNNPNFETRFGAGEGGTGGGAGGPGFYSVSTFSSSATKNVNGKPQTVQQASTTVNENGKVRTYTVKNP